MFEVERRADGALLPLLLLRANDWVPQVRASAQRAVRSMLQPAFVTHWCEALDAVVALERAGRADHRALLAEIDRYLTRREILPHVLAAAARGSEPLRRLAFQAQWSAAGDEQRPALLQRALAGSDRLVARLALSFVDRIAEASERAALAEAGCGSRFSPVRAQSLRILVAMQAPGTCALASALCLDRSATVRSVAWLHVRETPEAAVVVREALAQFKTASKVAHQCAAFEFLVMAAPEGAPCQQAWRSAQPRLRAVALAAMLSRPAAVDQEELLLAGLKDPSGRVQTVAVQAVLRGAAPPPPDVVMAVAQSHASLPALRRGVSVISRTSSWQRLLVLLRTLEAELPAGGVELCVRALADWQLDSYRSFLALRDEHRKELEALWPRVAPKLPARLRDQIRFHWSP